MDITLKNIPIREIVKGYVDKKDEGVFGFGGLLSIRPAFQREFVYRDKQRDEVINSVMNNFPLNTIYWSKNADGTYELLDGQQRIISICRFYSNDFSIKLDGQTRYFHNMPKDYQEKFLNYPLMIYICDGSDTEKIKWFQIINIAGEKLTNQELLNAIYAGPWVSDAKIYFSRPNCPAHEIADKYVNGKVIRQEYLETAIKWICDAEKIPSVEEYMAIHQHDTHATDLWRYFQDVISWAKTIFPVQRSKMKNVKWGLLYNRHKDESLDPNALEEQIKKLVQDDEVQDQAGIYEYVLTGDEQCLNLRAFSKNVAQAVYDKQKGVCKICKKHFDFEEMEADHIIPWRLGGQTVKSNCQMLCRKCNRTKAGK